MGEVKSSEGLTAQLCLLCVDDEVNILNALKRLFRREPFGVVTATSGEEGLFILRHNPSIGMILSDQRMPGLSGSAFLEVAKALFPHIPRMILTGYADIQSEHRSVVHGGACSLLAKPWDDQELLRAVRSRMYGGNGECGGEERDWHGIHGTRQTADPPEQLQREG